MHSKWKWSTQVSRACSEGTDGRLGLPQYPLHSCFAVSSLTHPWCLTESLLPGKTKEKCLGLTIAGAVLCLLGQPRKALVDVNLPWRPNFEKYIWSFTWQEKGNEWVLDLCWSRSGANSMGAYEGKARNKIRVLVKRLNRRGLYCQRGYKARRHPQKDQYWGVSQQSKGYVTLHPVFAQWAQASTAMKITLSPQGLVSCPTHEWATSQQ